MATLTEWITPVPIVDVDIDTAAEPQSPPARGGSGSTAEQLADLHFASAACAILDAIETATKGGHRLGVRSRSSREGTTLAFTLDGEAVAEFRPEDAELLSFALDLESRARPHLMEHCCALFEAAL